MVLSNQSSVSEDITQFEGSQQVTIKVCEGAMKRNQIDWSQLLPGVSTVEDSILEIVIKQSEGWGYIKETKN